MCIRDSFDSEDSEPNTVDTQVVDESGYKADDDLELEEDNLMQRWMIESGNPFHLSNPAKW